ncbi:hypothetical protein Pmani_039635 [Petrolisthes manimaculis]|uniref:Uncharacterized protein n=1 Tax=Petrolisthes manimaculis TaxID=1843537 RepID=A0AAE1NDB0_9EUCA|nr:hypothetical protein Pmani_039635 [Petrolisthes manimaculis]
MTYEAEYFPVYNVSLRLVHGGHSCHINPTGNSILRNHAWERWCMGEVWLALTILYLPAYLTPHLPASPLTYLPHPSPTCLTPHLPASPLTYLPHPSPTCLTPHLPASLTPLPASPLTYLPHPSPTYLTPHLPALTPHLPALTPS